MEKARRTKRKKLESHSDIHQDVCVPHLVTSVAQTKYQLMQPNLFAGLGITFNSFPYFLDKIRNVGWECLVVFHDRRIYPSLMAEFYSHMSFNKNDIGLLTSITTCIQGVQYIIDESVIFNALHLKQSTVTPPRINGYISPPSYSVDECFNFKQNLAFVTDQIVPDILFDFPVNIGLEFLTAPCQFLGKILRHNFMPARENRTISPFDLELIKCIINECMPYNLAYFLLTSFEHCFHNNCMGYGLLLTHLFKYLDINVLNQHVQPIPNTNVVSRLNLPPKPLIVFKDFDHEPIVSHLNTISQMDTLTKLNQLILHNQTNLMVQVEGIQATVEHLKISIQLLMENQRSSSPSSQSHHKLSSTIAPVLSRRFFSQLGIAIFSY